MSAQRSLKPITILLVLSHYASFPFAAYAGVPEAKPLDESLLGHWSEMNDSADAAPGGALITRLNDDEYRIEAIEGSDTDSSDRLVVRGFLVEVDGITFLAIRDIAPLKVNVEQMFLLIGRGDDGHLTLALIFDFWKPDSPTTIEELQAFVRAKKASGDPIDPQTTRFRRVGD